VYRHSKNKFKKCKDVTWDDVIEKLSYEFSVGSHKFIAESKSIPPSFVMHTNKFPGTLFDAFEELRVKENVIDMHVYMSLGSNSSTFGRHNDPDNVLIVQAIGEIQYAFDDENVITLTPGDSLLIKRGVYHTPIVSGPRVTLSSSVLEYNPL
tara:strand:- start:32 stop:487 length:456 start_codon:yes stop_codon:yes gene_type:complete